VKGDTTRNTGASLADQPTRAKCGDTMGKIVPDMARPSSSDRLEQNHVQMVSPYFRQRDPSTNPQPATRNSQTRNPGASLANPQHANPSP